MDVRDGFVMDHWHHVCLVWDAEEGKLSLTMDGNQTETRNVPCERFDSVSCLLILIGSLELKAAKSDSNEKLSIVFGQDQDTFGGGFQEEQSFCGAMADIKIWQDVALTPGNIQALRACVNIEPDSGVLILAHNNFSPSPGIESNTMARSDLCQPNAQENHLVFPDLVSPTEFNWVCNVLARGNCYHRPLNVDSKA